MTVRELAVLVANASNIDDEIKVEHALYDCGVEQLEISGGFNSEGKIMLFVEDRG